MRFLLLGLCGVYLLSGCTQAHSASQPANGALGDVASRLVVNGSPAPSTAPAAEDATNDPDRLLQMAIDQDIAGENHKQIFDRTYPSLSSDDKQRLDALVTQATSNVERMLILKTFAAGETMANIEAYAQEIRGREADEVLKNSTMHEEDTLIQQYQQTCGLAMVQVASSEYDPRYAWEMHKLGDVHAVNPDGPIAKQQVEWLHKYGGEESPRGVEGGKEIGILGPLNDMMGVFVHCTYTCESTPDVDAALSAIAGQVKAGFPAPIRVAFAGDIGHFMLVQAVQGERYRVYDPYYGKVHWMTSAEFKSGDLVPENGNKAYLTHWYRSAPK